MHFYPLSNKRCCIKSRTGVIYCNKCGKPLGDSYSISKHGSICNYSDNDFPSNYVFVEGKDAAYGMEHLYNKKFHQSYLKVSVYEPTIYPVGSGKGFKNDHGGWRKVYYFLTTKDGLFFEDGIQDFDYWSLHLKAPAVSNISGKTITSPSLNGKNVDFMEVIHDFHPEFLSVESLQSFYHVVKNGRISRMKKLATSDHACLDKIIGENSCTLYKKAKAAYPSETLSYMKESYVAFGRFLPMGDGGYLIFDVFEKKKENYLGSILVGDDIHYSNFYLEADALYKVRSVLAMEDARSFDRVNSSFNLHGYLLQGRKNALAYLYAANYHPLVEKAAKSGLYGLMDLLPYLKKEGKKLHRDSIQAITGIPVKLLKKFDPYLRYEKDLNFLHQLKKIYDREPCFLYEIKKMNLLIKDLIQEYEIVESGNYHPQSMAGILASFDKKQMLKYLRYLSEVNSVNLLNNSRAFFTYYRDYINMSKAVAVQGERINYFPKDLMTAHNAVMREFYRKKECEMNIGADHIFFNQAYVQLSSSFLSEEATDQDTESFDALQEACYKIVTPANESEVITEGRTLGHCVASYIPLIRKGKCFILFLRRKEDPFMPYATLEVSPDHRLIQVKARFNKAVDRKAAAYVKNYCKLKHIIYTDCYDLKRAQ